jgi:hypothetical protein
MRNRRPSKTRLLLIAGACASLLLGAGAADARSTRERVQIQDEPGLPLCRATAAAVAKLREEIGWPMTGLYGHGQGAKDRTVLQLTFYGLRTRSIEFVNGAGEKRTVPMAFYLVDLDNTPPVEMLDFVAGGHLATGDGTTLSVMKKDLSKVPQPVPDDELNEVALKIGPLDVAFRGKDFDLGYHSYPFAFAGRNYLFIEGNGEGYQPVEGQQEDPNGARNAAKDLVVELVANVGLVTRCYFAKEPGEPAK